MVSKPLTKAAMKAVPQSAIMTSVFTVAQAPTATPSTARNATTPVLTSSTPKSVTTPQVLPSNLPQVVAIHVPSTTVAAAGVSMATRPVSAASLTTTMTSNKTLTTTPIPIASKPLTAQQLGVHTQQVRNGVIATTLTTRLVAFVLIYWIWVESFMKFYQVFPSSSRHRSYIFQGTFEIEKLWSKILPSDLTYTCCFRCCSCCYQAGKLLLQRPWRHIILWYPPVLRIVDCYLQLWRNNLRLHLYSRTSVRHSFILSIHPSLHSFIHSLCPSFIISIIQYICLFSLSILYSLFYLHHSFSFIDTLHHWVFNTFILSIFYTLF